MNGHTVVSTRVINSVIIMHTSDKAERGRNEVPLDLTIHTGSA